MSTILVVDDSAVDRQLIDGLLTKEPDFEVWTAENPAAALKQLSHGAVDIVVTDLQMPETDGLQLVRQLSEQYPDLPSILVTAHGSEEIATAALDEGAAGYVPKAHLADRLVDTVRNTLALLEAERTYEDLVTPTTYTEFRFALSNNPALIPPLVDLVQQMMSGMGRCSTVQRLRLAVAIEQALLNALYHGNLELPKDLQVPAFDDIPSRKIEKFFEDRLNDPKYANRKIKVTIQIDRQQLKLTVVDEGDGFSPPSEQGISDDGGRGIVLMRAFMDKVEYNSKGNALMLVHKWDDADINAEPQADQHIDDTGDTLPGVGDMESGLGQLVSERSGRVIPLSDKRLVIGRRKTCHIVLPYREVSSHHCQLYVVEGWWFVKDLESGNGIKVNGKPLKRGRLDPGDTLTVAKYNYRIEYSPNNLGAIGPSRPSQA